MGHHHRGIRSSGHLARAVRKARREDMIAASRNWNRTWQQPAAPQPNSGSKDPAGDIIIAFFVILSLACVIATAWHYISPSQRSDRKPPMYDTPPAQSFTCERVWNNDNSKQVWKITMSNGVVGYEELTRLYGRCS